MFASVTDLPSRQDQALSDLWSAIATARRASTDADAVGPLLRAADMLTACAVSIIGRGGFAARTGLSPSALVKLEGRRTSTDANALSEIAALSTSMPVMFGLFTSGRLSFAQVRAIALAVRGLDVTRRRAVDDTIATRENDDRSDPDDLVTVVDEAVARIRPDLHVAREDRAIESSFIAIQGRLDGSAAIYGEADAASAATIIDALDAAAVAPVDADEEGAPTRARQRFDGLLAICERFLGGTSDPDVTTRPRPRLLATVDISEISNGGAHVLWGAAGRAPRISPLSADVLLCDAEIVPVVFNGARPVGVGNTTRTIPAKLRTALIARDGRCRFPGCRAPVAWTDAHHIVPVSEGGPTTEDNCLLLCRRCHRRVHRFRWKITVREDGVIDFRYRARTFSSRPGAHLRS